MCVAVLEGDAKEEISVGGVHLDHKILRLARDQLWSYRTCLGIQSLDILKASMCLEGDVQSACHRKHPDCNTLLLE